MTKLIQVTRFVRIAGALVVHTIRLFITLPFHSSDEKARHKANSQSKATSHFLRILKIDVEFHSAESNNHVGLIVSNHIGVLDPVILAANLLVCFAAKAEMATWFFVGPICRAVGTVFVQRDKKLSAKTFVTDIEDRISSGVSVLVFPEGTTSSGEFVRQFKTGAFEAIANRPHNQVIPVYIRVVHVNGDTSLDARRKLAWYEPGQSLLNNFWSILGIKSALVKVVEGPPIIVGSADRKQLAQTAYSGVTSLMSQVESMVQQDQRT